MNTAPAVPPAVVVTLGTDHHPFQRLVDWVDRWAGDHPEVSCLIQRGTARPPANCESVPLLGFDELRAAMAEAVVVVGHAGPGTIMDARAVGRRPIVVARLARHGEVVDDHQVTFARWMHERDQAALATDEPELHKLLDDALAHPDRYAVLDSEDLADPVVERIGDLIDGLLA